LTPFACFYEKNQEEILPQAYLPDKILKHVKTSLAAARSGLIVGIYFP
jgi:hypothetical protein